MDVKMQLLTVAIKQGEKQDPLLIEKAIDDAGYDAVEWYSLKKEKLMSHPFKPAPEKK